MLSMRAHRIMTCCSLPLRKRTVTRGTAANEINTDYRTTVQWSTNADGSIPIVTHTKNIFSGFHLKLRLFFKPQANF